MPVEPNILSQCNIGIKPKFGAGAVSIHMGMTRFIAVIGIEV
jgi:hypothetical protein